VIYPKIDEHPAGFSKTWLHILRKQLGFKGIIFSDDLGMMAAKQYGDIVHTVKVALAAGCDRVLLCNEPDAVAKVLEGLNERIPCQSNAILEPAHAMPDWQGLRKNVRWQMLHKKYETYFV
jgi:beta-N-acetylhexosaminidase